MKHKKNIINLALLLFIIVLSGCAAIGSLTSVGSISQCLDLGGDTYYKQSSTSTIFECKQRVNYTKEQRKVNRRR